METLGCAGSTVVESELKDSTVYEEFCDDRNHTREGGGAHLGLHTTHTTHDTPDQGTQYRWTELNRAEPYSQVDTHQRVEKRHLPPNTMISWKSGNTGESYILSGQQLSWARQADHAHRVDKLTTPTGYTSRPRPQATQSDHTHRLHKLTTPTGYTSWPCSTVRTLKCTFYVSHFQHSNFTCCCSSSLSAESIRPISCPSSNSSPGIGRRTPLDCKGRQISINTHTMAVNTTTCHDYSKYLCECSSEYSPRLLCTCCARTTHKGIQCA